MHRRFLLISMLILLISSSSILAAVTENEVCVDRTCIVIEGEIVAGDFDRFRSLVSRSSLPISVSIDSPGGDLVEAMKIGRLIRESFFSVSAPSDQDSYGSCYSACFLIWVSGIHRVGGRGRLGVHRPRFDQEYFANLSAKEADAQYKRLLQELRAYMKTMDVPESIIERVFSISSGDLHVLTNEEFFLLWGRDGYVPSISEWLYSKCGEITEQEWADLEDLNAQAGTRTLSRAEQFYRKSLQEKVMQVWPCRLESIKKEQVARRRGN